MFHPFLPASHTVMGVEDCITKATPGGGRWFNTAEMGQTVQNPFFIIGIREILETV